MNALYRVDGKAVHQHRAVKLRNSAAGRIRVHFVLRQKRQRVYTVRNDFYVVKLIEILSDEKCRTRAVKKNNVAVFYKLYRFQRNALLFKTVAVLAESEAFGKIAFTV